MSLYLVVPAADIERLRPLIRLMVIQIGNRLTRHVDIPGTGAVKPKGLRGLWQRICSALRVVQHAAKGGSKQRLLIILDEFPLLGYLPWIESAIAFLRGYKIKLFLIVQSLNQLEKVYGPNHAFLDNSWVRFTYTSFDDRTAERISNLLGKRTVVQTQVSKTRKAGAFWAQSYNESQQYTARPLKTAGELLTLPYDEVIVFAGGVPPYQGTKLQYFLHPLFVARANLPRPDSTREQLAELPRPLPAIEWRGLAPIAAVITAAPAAPHQNLQPALEFFGADALADVEPYADAPFHDDEEAALLDAYAETEAQEGEEANP